MNYLNFFILEQLKSDVIFFIKIEFRFKELCKCKKGTDDFCVECFGENLNFKCLI